MPCYGLSREIHRRLNAAFTALVAIGSLAILCSQRPQITSAAEENESKSNVAVTVEIPRLNVSEYHRPYVAVWIENESNELIEHVSVWYQQDKSKEGHGEKWLPDLRQWWRRGGRDLDVPVDGVSGATRPVGKHDISVPVAKLERLSPGAYTMVVEASREVGGREVVKLPFQWPLTKPETVTVAGKAELGDVVLHLSQAVAP